MNSVSYGWWGALMCLASSSGCGEDTPDLGVSRGGERGEDSTGQPEAATNSDSGSDSGGETSGQDAPSRDGGAALDDAGGPWADEPQLTFDGEPLDARYVRLTHRQWENSVVANLRLDDSTALSRGFTADPSARYSNNEALLFVGQPLLENYQEAAATIAQYVAADPAVLERVSQSREPEVFIQEVGRRFYRRPLTASEQTTYLALFELGESMAFQGEDEFAAGVQLVLEVWMQAPSFLYRVEHSEGLLNGYEMATRLALSLTDKGPSDALLNRAEKGELDTISGVEGTAEALLVTPEAAMVFRRFHDETFSLQRLTALPSDGKIGPPAELGSSLAEAAHLFFDRQFREGFGFRELLLSDVGFVNDELAAYYEVTTPNVGSFELTSLGPTRRGIFAQLPFLMLDSWDATPNAFKRGGMLVRNVLCQPVPPHPEAITEPLPTEVPLTNRESSTQAVASGVCASCHQYVDPYGFAFENFDGHGRLRLTDNGFPVDTTGANPLSPRQQFADSTELMTILARSPLAHDCYAKNLTEFSLGRSLGASDATVVQELGAASSTQNASLAQLVTALVRSDTFRSAGVSP